LLRRIKIRGNACARENARALRVGGVALRSLCAWPRAERRGAEPVATRRRGGVRGEDRVLGRGRSSRVTRSGRDGRDPAAASGGRGGFFL